MPGVIGAGSLIRIVRRLRAHALDPTVLRSALCTNSPRWRVRDFLARLYRVHAYRLDGITETYRAVCFDFDYGHFIEVNEGMGGFEEMLSHLGEYLRLPADYIKQIEAAKCDADPITLYCRA
jgi:hypothetical protein